MFNYVLCVRVNDVHHATLYYVFSKYLQNLQFLLSFCHFSFFKFLHCLPQTASDARFLNSVSVITR
jgi:hypothetical protein